ncbi:hypothetical protein LQW54_012178 [Pestalotiopsis sp. IQ-011]
MATVPVTAIDHALRHMPAEPDKQSPYFDDVLAQVKSVIFAGYHTTSQAICWVLYEIFKHPDIVDKIRSEHNDVLGSDPSKSGELLSKQAHKLNELRYTTAVIKETLRLHAIAQTNRAGSPSFNFSVDGVVYETDDTIIQTVPDAAHSNPDYWPRATEFIPERFLVTADDPLYPRKNAWRPFELGTTRCIGEELAMTEMKLVLVMTLRDFDFQFGTAPQDTKEIPHTPTNSVNGDHIYSVGEGLGCLKDNLPTRVRLRSS